MSDFDAQDLTAAGSGKSEAEIAFELVSKLKGQGVWGERNMADILDCLLYTSPSPRDRG